MLSQLLSGARCLTAGLSWVLASGNRRFVVFPIVVSALITTVLLGWALQQRDLWLLSWEQSMPSSVDWVLRLLRPLLSLVIIIGSAWLTSFMAVVLLSPFLGLICERASGTTAPTNFSLRQILASFLRELRKLGYHLLRLLLLGLCFLIPIVNLAAPLVAILLAAWLTAIQFIDLAADNEQMSFSQGLDCMLRQRWRVLGFGGAIAALLALPFAALIVVPAAAAGAGFIWQQLKTDTSL